MFYIFSLLPLPLWRKTAEDANQSSDGHVHQAKSRVRKVSRLRSGSPSQKRQERVPSVMIQPQAPLPQTVPLAGL